MVVKKIVPVRNANIVGPVVLFTVAGCLLIGAIGLCFAKPLPWVAIIVLLVISLISLGAGLIWFKKERGRRLWVQITPEGFILIDPEEERTIDDDQILALSLYHKTKFRDGLPRSSTRYFTLWVNPSGLPGSRGARVNADVRSSSEDPHRVDNFEGMQQIKLVNTIDMNDQDPLLELVRRNYDRLLEQAREEFQQGQSVYGEGWILQRDELYLTKHKESIPLDDLTVVDIVDDDICCWVEGFDEAILKLEPRTANAQFLLQLLQQYLQDHPKQEHEPDNDRLGRIIFERRPDVSGFRVFVGFAILLAIVSLCFFVAALAVFEWVLALLGLGCLLGMALCIQGAAYYRVAFFRCHAWGVHRRTLFSDKRLRYRDVESFTYLATRHFTNGAYSGSTFFFTLDPIAEEKDKKISYFISINGVDAELENLRDQISRMIGYRMLQRVRQGESVQWTKKLRFVPEGLEILAKERRKTKPRVLSYDEIENFNLQEGSFYLWLKNQEDPVFEEPVSEPNFFPGFIVLNELLPQGLATYRQTKTTGC